ncbi:MAG: TIGR03767 family metallophosphoesterase, partial [Nocardioidaceae bacterium]|nr:TIGR03767 family metallophosphoesterase [Nocardioidaceae bacterium]
MRSTVVAAGAIALSGPGALARAAVGTQITSRTSLVPSSPSSTGYRKVVAGPAEARVVRADLGVKAATGRGECRTPLLAFAQFSDTHVVDHQSPARLEWTDRLEDPSAAPALGIFASSYRPHEMLTGHVLDAMVQAVNDQGVGPVTGLALAFMIETGDNSDNSQFNEVRWNIDILDGVSGVAIDSGSPDRYEGVMDQDVLTYDPHYYHPDGAPSGRVVDAYQTKYGFPAMPGLLDTAREPFDATGLNVPWYSCFGNHDGLMQGNFPWNSLQLDLLATGGLKIISSPAGVSVADLADAVTNQSLGTLLNSLVLGPGVELVTPDHDRRSLNRGEFVEEHFTSIGSPVGHGFTETNRNNDTAYYSFDSGNFRFIVMDTVNPNGFYEGSIDQAQFAWLKTTVLEAADKAVLIFRHHTSASMTNPLVLTGLDPALRVLGGDVVEFFLTQPQVIAWVNGHTHRNEIISHQRAGGGGFWEINTAAHIDWPQQARLIEVADNGDKTWSIFTTVLDHAGPADPGPSPSTPRALASLSREFSANEPQA